MNGAIIRIALRYGVGVVIGIEAGQALAGDPDLVMLIAAAAGCVTEWVYAMAKRKGWSL